MIGNEMVLDMENAGVETMSKMGIATRVFNDMKWMTRYDLLGVQLKKPEEVLENCVDPYLTEEET